MQTLYTPPVFKNTNLSELQDFIRKFPFATVISSTNAIRVSHLPLLLQPEGEYGTLVGHMAKANKQWQDFDGSKPVVCVLHGPHAYTSPSWYETLPEVPTWNYAVVHAEGFPQLITEKAELLDLVNQTISSFEPSLHNPECKAYIPESCKISQLDFIVGFKIEITQLQGKYKLGQNRTLADQQGIIEGLEMQDNADAKQLAEFMCNNKNRLL